MLIQTKFKRDRSSGGAFRFLIIVCVACMQLFSVKTRANLIQNPSFEDGNVDWTYVGDAYIHGLGPPATPHSGSTYAYFGPYAPIWPSMSQTVATVPGETYKIDFWIASNGGNGNIYSSFGNFTGFNEYNPGGYYSYLEVGYTAVATDTTTQLVIGGYGITATFYLDDISVEPVNQVPEKGQSVWMLGIALCGLIGFGRLLNRAQLLN
jgi:hypothetical protein